MKKILIAVLIISASALGMKTQAQTQFKVITTIESVVPGGLGRSRIIDDQTPLDYEKYTTERTDGKKSDQGKVKRSDIKIDTFKETKMVNFFSLAGINFQNVASNDAMITSMLNKMTADGWKLVTIVSGVKSPSDKDKTSIFITRYYFSK